MKTKKTESKKTAKTTKTAAAAAPATTAEKSPAPRTFRELPLEPIRVNPLNPRKIFSGKKYDDLLASVRTKGVIVPILVRPLAAGDDGKEYEIIAGERRFRAACEVAKGNGGIKKARIPALVQEMTDDDAYDCMTIENLQREDLTPLEEARAFDLYLKRKGEGALSELAERVGINPCYIRRRVAVLGLPENVLQKWEKGELSYGHLEQFIRLDAEQLKEVMDYVGRGEWSVKQLKHHVEDRTPKLSTALFHPKKDACATCQKNTDVQRSLFGEEIGAKALCFGPGCFKEKQGAWILENWEKFTSSRDIHTNGFRFRNELRWDQYESMYNQPKSKCKTCDHFVSVIQLSGSVDIKTACVGDKGCYKTLYQPASKEAKKAADPDAPRVSWHGEHFREEFYKTRIPELVTALPSDDEKTLRIVLLSLLESHNVAAETFGQKYDQESCTKSPYGGGYHYSVFGSAWAAIEKLDSDRLKSILHEMSLLILMDSRTTTAPTRRSVAVHLGSDLAAEWRMTKEYLDKKTTKEIHAIADQHGIFQDEKAKTYLYEKLLKKRDRFDLCKKAELVKVILESGVDLAGKVPAEILKEDKSG